MKTVEELTDLFRAEGLRVTPQRQAVFGLLQGNGEHPTVDSLYDDVRRELPTISLKTVYETVHELEELGEVSVLDVGTGSVRVDPNVEVQHHHMVCTVCGMVRDVPWVDVPTLPTRYRKEFRPEAVEVIFRGICERCSKTTTEE
jgi:Fe2+ or Zn2+ uptake regulation protein